MNEAAIKSAREFQAEEGRLKEASRWSELIQLYEARAGYIDSAGKERLFFKAGEVATDQLGDSRLAEDMFLRAFGVRSSFLPAIGALKVLHTANKNDGGLLQIIDLELEITTDARRRGQLLYEKAALLQAKQPEQALEVYSASLKAYPKSRAPLEPLEALARKLKRWEPLVQAYQDLAEAAKTDQAAVYYFLGGMVLDEHKRDRDAAAAAFNASLDSGASEPRILNVIARFFEKNSDWGGLAKSIWQHLEVAKGNKERCKLLKRQAWVHETHLKQPERAQRLLQKAVEANPQDPGAIKSLFAVSKVLKDHQGMAEALEAEGELKTLSDKDRGERFELAAEQRDRAREGKLAYKNIKRSLELRPKAPRALKLLERITRKLGSWTEHAEVLEQELELLKPERSEQERKAALAILQRMAEVNEVRLKNRDAAKKALRQLIELDPSDEGAWDKLDVMVREDQEWREVCDLLVKRVEVSEGEARQRNMRALAVLQRDQLEDLTAAAETLEVLTNLAPDDAEGLALLCSVYEASKKHELLAGTLAQLADAVEGPAEKAAVLRQLAGVQLDHLGKAADAKGVLSEALSLEGEGEGGLSAYKLLAKAADQLGDDALLRQALNGAQNFEQDPETLRWTRIQLAKIDERSGNTTGALGAIEEVLAESAGDAEALAVVLRLLKKLERYEDAAQRLEAAAQAMAGDVEQAAALSRELGALCEEFLEDPARARGAWARALRLEPANKEAFARVTKLARASEAYQELYDLLEEVSDRVEDPEQRHSMWREGAFLATTKLKSPQAAALLHERVMGQAPDDPAATIALRLLYRELERWGDLAALLERAAMQDSGAVDVDGCWRELARVAREHLDDHPRAAAALETVLEGCQDPEDPAWEALAATYTHLDANSNLVRVHERLAALLGDPLAKAARLAQAAEVYERRLLDYDNAARVLQEALTATPGSADLLLSQARVLRSAGSFAEASKVLQDAAAAVESRGDARDASNLFLERGKLLAEHLGDPTGAEAAYKSAIQTDPANGRAHEALVDLLEAQGQWDTLDDALKAAAESADDPEIKASFYVRLGELLVTRLNRLDEALAACDKAEEARPALALCRQARVNALRLAQRPKLLAAALAGRRKAEPPQLTTAERIALLREEAELRAFQLDELQEAADLLSKALELRAKDQVTLRSLLRVERQLGLGKPLADHLETAALLEKDGKRRASLLLEAGRVLKTREGDRASAKRLLVRALKADPQRIETVRWLVTIAREDGDDQEVATWLEREAELESEPRRRAELLTRLGGLQAKAEPEAARAAFERALAEDPKQLRAWRGLAPLLRREKAWPELAKALVQLANLEPDPRLQVERYVALGEIYLQVLADRQQARDAFDKALARSPELLRALHGRARTFNEEEDAAGLVSALRAEMQATPLAEQRVALGRRVASLQVDRLEDPAGAVASLEEVLRLRALDQEAWRILRDIHVQSGDYAALTETYEREARANPDVKQQEHCYRAAAQLCQHHLQDTQRAANLYQEVLNRGDPHVIAVKELPLLLLKLGDDESYERCLRRIPSIVPQTRLASEAFVTLGARAAERSQFDLAVRHFEAALREKPDSVRALDKLAEVHRQRKEFPLLVKALRRKRELLGKDPQAIDLHLLIARHLQVELHDEHGAIDELLAADVLAQKLGSPGRKDILAKLRKLCRRCERYGELTECLGALAELSEGEEAAALLIERAEIEREKQSNRRAAIISYQAAFAQHEDLASLEPRLELLEEAELWEELVMALEDRARLEKDARVCAEIYARAAGVLDDALQRPEEAIRCWEQVLDAIPDHAGAFQALDAICLRTGNQRAHARALEREVSSLLELAKSDAGARGRLVHCALQAAGIYSELRLDDRASAVLERAREGAALDRRLFERLDSIYTESKRWPQLYELLGSRAAGIEDAEERATLYERLAVLAAEELADPDAERSHWASVLAISPAHPQAVEALKRSYADVADWESLAQVMQGELSDRQARAAKGEEAARDGLADLCISLGEVLEGKLGRRKEAIAVLSEAATLAKGDPRPLRGLERIHLAGEAWEDLIRVRQALRDQEADPSGRAALALDIADAWDQLGKRAEATTALREALEELPDDLGILGRLRSYLVEEERWEDAVQMLAREADVVPERALEFDRRMERAEILRDRLDRSQEAIAEFERARGLAPQDVAPLLALAPLYEAAQLRVPLVEVLEARANLEEDDATSADLYAKAGALNVEANTKHAAESYEKALRRDPLRSGPLESLEGLYASRESWSAQARTLHRRAELARALEEDTAPWWRRAAEVEEQRLESKSLAATTIERILAVDAQDDGALAELARLRGELGEHAAHEVVLGKRAALAEGAARRDLLLERARILDEKLSRPGAAAACVRSALLDLAGERSADPKDVRRMAGELMRLQEVAGDPSGLLDASELALKHPKDAADETNLLGLIGRLASSSAYRPARAIEVYEQLYARKAEDPQVLEALEGLYRRESRNEDLAKLFHREAERLMAAGAPSAEVIQLSYREAELHRTVLGDLATATKRFKEILATDPDQESARDGLEAIYRAGGMNQHLAELLGERAARARDHGVAAQALSEQGAVNEELGDLEAAVASLEKALERSQQGGVASQLRGRILRTLVRLYRRQDRFEELARALSTLSGEKQLSGEERSDVLSELGVVLVRDLSKPAEAVEAFEHALREDPGNVPAARALASIYVREEEWAKVVTVYEREAAAKVDKGRLVWLKNRIGALRQQLGQKEEARDAYREALSLDPQSLVALRGLAQVARELEDPRELAPVLAALAEQAPSPVDRTEARRELAKICDGPLDDRKRAVACWRQVLADAPDDLEALQGLASGLRALGDKPGLVETVEHELGLVGDAERRRLLGLDACRLREDLASAEQRPEGKKEQLEKALEHARMASELNPSETEGVAAYARVAEKLGRWKELADATCHMARSVDDTNRCGWMLRKAAKIRSLRLGDARGAAEAYLEAVKVAPADSESWEALEPLARDLKDDKLLLRVLEKLLQLAKGPAKKAEIALRLGLQLLRMQKLPRAIDALVVAREHGRGQHKARALEQLEVAYRAAERWDELVVVLGERASGRVGNAQELLLEQAKVYEEQLGRNDKAIEVLSALRQQDMESVVVSRELERILSKESRWADLVQFYDQEARRLGRAGYESLVLLGRVARDRLDDPDLAADALQRAVTLNPSGQEALEGLKALYARIERWSELLDTLRLEIGLVKDPQVKVKRLRYAGQLAEDRLGDLVTAERFFREASQLAPQDIGLVVSLARVQESRGEFRGLVDTLGRQLSLEKRPAERLVLFKKMGQVLASRLYRPFEAIRAYRHALEIDGSDAESQVALSDQLRSQGEWEDLVQILSHRLPAAQGAEQVALQLELALVSAHKLDQPKQALASAQQALARDPNCLQAVKLQVDVGRTWGRERKQFAELAQALEKLASMTSDPEERATLLVELGDLCREDLKDPARALEAYREAFKADNGNEAALENYVPLLRAANSWDELVQSFELGARASTGFRCGELLTQSAEILEQKKKDGAKAETRYREALGHAPSHPPALRGLARRLVAGGAGKAGADRAQAEELVRVLLAIAKVEEDPASQAKAFVRAGDVYRDALGLYEQGRRCYELAVERNPQDVETLAALAEMAWAADDQRTALRHLSTLASDPKRLGDSERAAELLWARGVCLERAGRLQEAAASYRQVLEYRQSHLQALEDLGRLLLGARQWKAARPVVEELVRRTRPPKVRASHTLALARACAELKDEEQAISLYREGLKIMPRRFDAHLAVAELLKERDPKESKRHYEYVVAGGGDEEGEWASIEQRVEARTELAHLGEIVFKDADTAAAHLQAAIELPGLHCAKTCRHLAEIHGRAGRWPDAVHNLKLAIEHELDREQLAELHGSLARVLRDRMNQPTLARRCFEKSLELNPADRKTMESLLRLLDAAGDLDAQARTLEFAAKQAQEGRTGDEAALRMRRAEVLLGQKKAQLAAREFERVLALEPSHSGARACLAKLYLELGDVRGAERIHRALLAEDPLLVGSYQALSRAWRLGGKEDAHGQVVQVLEALQAAKDAEDRKLVRSFGDRMPRTKAQVKEDEFVASIAHEGGRGAMLDFMRKAGPALLRQVPDDLKKHGIGWRTARHGIGGDAFPEHTMVKRICDLLGIDELDVYWMPEWKNPEPIIGHAKGKPALILCPEVFAGLEENEKAFVLGRALGPLRLNLQLFLCLPEQDVRLIILGALKGFDSSNRTFQGEEEKLARNTTKQIARATELHASLRNSQLGLWRRQEEIDYTALKQAAALTGSRAGLLASGGMHAASRAIVATNMSLRGRVPETTQGVIKVYREIPELKDLISFAVSEGYLRLRERCLRTE